MSLRRRLAIRRSLSGPASRDRRHDRDLVLLRHLRLQAAAKADVLVVEVDVDELPQLAPIVEQAVFEARAAAVHCVGRSAEVPSFDHHGPPAAGQAADPPADPAFSHYTFTFSRHHPTPPPTSPPPP